MLGAVPRGWWCWSRPDKRGGSELASGHPVNRIVHEEDGDVFATIRRVNNLGGADGGKVAVSLIGNHELVWMRALDGCSDCGGASVSGLHVADVKVVVGEHRTTDGADKMVLSLTPSSSIASAINL